MRALVVTGYGINCDREMAHACAASGFSVETRHAKELLENAALLEECSLLAFPGGFSFGDELGAAKAFANRLSAPALKERLERFAAEGGLIIGICNGFQLLVKLGLLPGGGLPRCSLTYNDSCRFEARWAYHKVAPSPCVFTQGLDRLYLPVRHGEGKFVSAGPDLQQQLFEKGRVALQYADGSGNTASRYPDNPNGSADAVAALTDETGRIFGMMAHPEAALYLTNHPRWTRIKEEKKRKGEPLPQYGDGFLLFQNAKEYLLCKI